MQIRERGMVMRLYVAGLVLAGARVALTASPAAAQMNAMPVYFTPKGGTGITFAVDYGRISSRRISGVLSTAHPSSIGGRVSLGLPIVTVGVAAGTYDPNVVTQKNDVQYAGTAAFKVFGGPLIPLAVSLQAGVGYLKQGTGTFAITTLNVPVGLGVALNIPTPGASLEPWVAGRVHLRSTREGNSSVLQVGSGVSGGISLGLPMGLGLHIGLDWIRLGAKTSGLIVRSKTDEFTVGAGAHYSFRIPGLGGIPIVPGV